MRKPRYSSTPSLERPACSRYRVSLLFGTAFVGNVGQSPRSLSQSALCERPLPQIICLLSGTLAEGMRSALTLQRGASLSLKLPGTRCRCLGAPSVVGPASPGCYWTVSLDDRKVTTLSEACLPGPLPDCRSGCGSSYAYVSFCANTHTIPSQL